MREVSLDDWGKALLEEVLFRAGRQVSDEPFTASTEITLTVRLASDPMHDRIEISVPSETDTTIVTHLPRPF